MTAETRDFAVSADGYFPFDVSVVRERRPRIFSRGVDNQIGYEEDRAHNFKLKAGLHTLR